MKRWWLMVGLLLSVGFNLGLLAAAVGGWWGDGRATDASPPPEAVAPAVAGDASPDGAGLDGGGVAAGEVAVEAGAGEADAGEAGDGGPPPAGPGPDVGVPADGGAQAGRGEGTTPAAGGAMGEAEGPEAVSQGADAPPALEPPRAGGPPPAPGRLGEDGGEGGGEHGRGAPQAGSPQGPQGPPLDRMADHLGLQGEVRGRFLELQRRFVGQRMAIQVRGRALTVRMHQELASADPDPALVGELIARRAELWVEHEQLTARTILETRALLDAEQQRRYLRVLRRLMEGGGPREGAVGDRPQPPRRRFGRGPAAAEPPG